MSEIIKTTSAGEGHQVITLKSESHAYRKTPCPGCPWKVSNTGDFPAEAFKVSASTAYDMAQNVFSCHESGKDKPATCAGFLLRGAEHNLAVRMGILSGRYKDDVSDGGHELHAGYVSMAEANEVPAEDPSLQPCRRSSHENF